MRDVNPALKRMVDINVRPVKGVDHKAIYVNSSRMGVSPWDVRIVVGQVVEVDDGGQLNEDLATLIMSPGHAKAFLKNMEKTITVYEETFGTIPDVSNAVKKAIEEKATRETPQIELKTPKRRIKVKRN